MINIKIKFEGKLVLSAILITSIPLIISYIIFVNDKIITFEDKIKATLKDTAFVITQNNMIKEDLYYKHNDFEIQEYTKTLISEIDDVDLIVICDMDGRKYSHLDESQIGDIFVNPDKHEVLAYGKSYYSLMEGSMGKTLRWFEPVFYNDEQVGFVMVGKYYSDIMSINSKTTIKYIFLFLATFILALLFSKIFAHITKKSILNMEPEEIAKLYSEKNIIINNCHDGIIALDKNNNVTEINDKCYDLFEDFNVDNVIERLQKYIYNRDSFTMKELIIQNKKIFVTLKSIVQEKQYLGVVIVLSDRENIRKVAKEITGVDEMIKSLRANIHEFKNNLHVILGLIQLEEYNQAKEYILKIQKVQEDHLIEFSQINDPYARALLLSRKLVAKERNIEFTLNENSNLYGEHGIVESEDIVTILGNLIENSYEACTESKLKNKKVDVLLSEDKKQINIVVSDNGIPIKLSDNSIFLENVSSKGDNRGTGLYLVKNRVDLYNGNITINKQDNKKIFNIILFKGGEFK